MNLEQATSMMSLTNPLKGKQSKQTRSALSVARNVFELSARIGEPYESITPSQWATKWLASERFVLVDIAPSQVAVPFANKFNREKINLITASAMDGQVDPIVIDLNRLGIGPTNSGYVPPVIVVDGRHRFKSQVNMGKDRIKAWVGEKALEVLQNRQKHQKRVLIHAGHAGVPQATPLSRIVATATLRGATSMPVIQQDTGNGGSRPTGGSVSAKKVKGMGGPGGSASVGGGSGPSLKTVINSEANGARSSGSYEDTDPSDKKVPPDPSDTKQAVDPSDRVQWNPDKPQQAAPGTEGNTLGGCPSCDAPGAGVGPRVKSKYGANNSELARGTVNVRAKAKIKQFQGKSIKVDEMWQKNLKGGVMEAVAPPGRESQVKKLKKKFGKKAAFKIAWSQYGK